MTPRIIIGISGASGFQYGVKALELLRPLAIEVHLVVSKGAEKTCELETDYRLDEVMALADRGTSHQPSGRVHLQRLV
ncbi:3-polyprenyl-4-hydroxybenzoate carboxy-lyase UbiX [Klebsiella pneumoniae]|uniref:3-polyprenyl-4-hydroxybenzoate carboxy-lyase UbiX n=1 Tax=Klebsiella pneumoniae TaxID=573 RepID=A0A377XF67_KLEPN|nr:3-polyprenyl-4-hydroxybenzoate carboxy-lyase UbiX [Klebsiella pneumoniae]